MAGYSLDDSTRMMNIGVGALMEQRKLKLAEDEMVRNEAFKAEQLKLQEKHQADMVAATLRGQDVQRQTALDVQQMDIRKEHEAAYHSAQKHLVRERANFLSENPEIAGQFSKEELDALVADRVSNSLKKSLESQAADPLGTAQQVSDYRYRFSDDVENNIYAGISPEALVAARTKLKLLSGGGTSTAAAPIANDPFSKESRERGGLNKTNAGMNLTKTEDLLRRGVIDASKADQIQDVSDKSQEQLRNANSVTYMTGKSLREVPGVLSDALKNTAALVPFLGSAVFPDTKVAKGKKSLRDKLKSGLKSGLKGAKRVYQGATDDED